MSQNNNTPNTRIHDYEYIGRTYCIALEDNRSRLIYMNGLRHRHFPIESCSIFVDFLVDIYATIGELIDDYNFHYREDRQIRIVYGDVVYDLQTQSTYVVSRCSLLSRLGRGVHGFIERKRQDYLCRTHPYSRTFYEWKGRYPTYEEYRDILSAILL
jgi:hypothetical protein